MGGIVMDWEMRSLPAADPAPEPAGPRRVTLADVAAAAGVSVSVAWQSLSDFPTVPPSPATAARVREAAERLGYRRGG